MPWTGWQGSQNEHQFNFSLRIKTVNYKGEEWAKCGWCLLWGPRSSSDNRTNVFIRHMQWLILIIKLEGIWNYYRNKPLAMTLREFLDWANWEGKALAEFECCHSLVWSPELTEWKGGSELSHTIHLVLFLNCTCHVITRFRLLPSWPWQDMVDTQMLSQNKAFPSYFC